MKTFKCIVIVFCVVFLPGMLLPALAATVDYTDPGWISSPFHELDVSSRSLEFDSDDNLYIETIGNDGGSKVRISWLDADSEPVYSDRQLYASYDTTYYGVTGLSFDGMGRLYVSERDEAGDAGAIREIDTATGDLVGDVFTMGNHRPTGVDSDNLGNVYYTGRRDSAPGWGRVFQINPDGTRDIIISNLAGTGIAVDDAGRIFVSTSRAGSTGYTGSSIYMFDPTDMSNPLLIATFEDPADELAFDENGYLYALDNGDHRTITRLAPVPVPAALWLLASGIVGLFCVRRGNFKG